MRIAGLQKVSTIDYPGEICCVVFLHGCNFRCRFCHNPDLVIGKIKGGFSEEEVLDFLNKRRGKLDAVCISGGEPLMSLDFDFVRKIKEMGFKIKVDTNGSFPERLKKLIDLELVDYVAMDVKGSREDYSRIVGVDVDLSKIEESIKIVNDFDGGIGVSGHGGMGWSEFRTTVVGRLHSRESLIEMVKWMNEVCGERPKRFFLQGFKNRGDLVGESFEEEKDVSEEFLGKLEKSVKGYFGEVGVRV